MASGGSITLRLSVAGANEVKAQLASLGPAGAAALHQIDAAARKAKGGMEGFGASVDKSLDKVFDSSKLAVLNAGATRLRVFGSALEPLGAAGIAAATGITAMALAGGGILKAAKDTGEWAETLQRFSKTTGQSAAEVQKWDFVAQSMGIGIDKMRASMAGLGEVVGQVKENLVRGQEGPQVRIFEAIFGTENDVKGTEEKLRQLGDVENILPVILGYVSKLDATGREAISRVLRIDPEVLSTLAATPDKVGEVIATWHRYGLAMDDDVIRKSAEGAEKMHVAAAIIQTELRGAVVSLIDPLGDAAERTARMTLAITDLIRGAQASLAPLQQMIEKLNQVPGAQASGAKSGSRGWLQTALQGFLDQVPGAGPLAEAGLFPILRGTAAVGAGVRQSDENTAQAKQQRDAALEAQREYLQAELDGARDIKRLSAAQRTMVQQLADVTFKQAVLSADENSDLTPAARLDAYKAARAIRDNAIAHPEDMIAALPPDASGHKKKAPASRDDQDEAAAAKTLLEAQIKAATDLDELHTLRLGLIDEERDAAIQRADDQKKKKEISGSAHDDLVQAANLTHGADVSAENAKYSKAQADHARAVGDAMAKFEDERLEADAQMAGTLASRQALERRKLEEDLAKERQDTASNDKLQLAETIIAEFEQEREQSARRAALAMKQTAEAAEDAAKQASLSQAGQIEMLKAQAALAHTTARRRDLALRIFDLEEQQKEAELRSQAANAATPQARQDAAAQLANAQATAPLRRAAVSDQYANPFQKMVQDAKPLDQAFTDIAADGLAKFNDGLVQANGKIANMGQLLRATFASALVALEKYLLEQAEISVLKPFVGGGSSPSGSSQSGGDGGISGQGALSGVVKAITGGSSNGGTGGSGIVGSIGNLFSSLFDGAGSSTIGVSTALEDAVPFAEGGPTGPHHPLHHDVFDVLLRTAPRYAGGMRNHPLGLIRGPGTSKSDSILAWVSDKEFVSSAEATRRNLPLLLAMNAGHAPRSFADGGYTGASSDYAGALGSPAIHFHNDNRMYAPGADPAQLQRLADQQKTFQRGEPQRFAAYMKAAKKQGRR